MDELLVLVFDQDKVTPNAVRFKERERIDGERASVGSIYVLKRDLKGLGDPKSIQVTIESAD